MTTGIAPAPSHPRGHAGIAAAGFSIGLLLAAAAGCGGVPEPPAETVVESIETEIRLDGCRLLVRADPREGLVGDPIMLLVVAEPAAGLVASLDPPPVDWGDFEASPAASPLLAGLAPGSAVRLTELRAFEGGTFRTPAFRASFEPRGGGAAIELASDPLSIEIRSVLADAAGPAGEAAAEELRDLKASVRLSDPLAWAWWLGSVAATGVVLASLFLLLRRRREAPPPPPEQVALAAIDRLAADAPADAAGLRAQWTGLVAVLRRYLEARLGIAATSQTGEELVAALGRDALLSQRHRNEIASLLREADLVRFAGASADRRRCEEALEAVRTIVEETAPAKEGSR
jgi:hypothetical protein